MIGVFDSGLGGLSVLAAIEQRLPQADLCYLADFACAPYGDKGDDFIRDRALAISRYFVARGCSLIVVACNTATSVAVREMRHRYDIPIIGMEPAANASTRCRRASAFISGATASSRSRMSASAPAVSAELKALRTTAERMDEELAR